MSGQSPSIPLKKACQIKPPKKEAREKIEKSDMVSFAPMNDLGVRQKYLVPTQEKQFGTASSSYTYFSEGDVLLAKITPCFENGKLGIARDLTNGVGFGSSEFFVLRPKECLKAEYLFYYLSQDSFRDLGRSVMSGAVGHKRVPKEFIENHHLPLPTVSEQEHIVAILDEAFAGIDAAITNTEKNLRNARELFETYLNSVFTQTETWGRYPLEDVLALQPQNGWSPPAKNHSDTGTPVLTLSSVTGFVFRPEKVKFTSAETDPERHYWVKNGDLLITRSNTPELVGHVAIAERLDRPTIYPDLVMRMRPDPTKSLTMFLYYQLRSDSLREVIKGRAQGANPTMKKISKKEVQTLPISLPSIEKQEEIICGIETVQVESERLVRIYQRKLSALRELKESLLGMAFAGELISGNAQPKNDKSVA